MHTKPKGIKKMTPAQVAKREKTKVSNAAEKAFTAQISK